MTTLGDVPVPADASATGGRRRRKGGLPPEAMRPLQAAAGVAVLALVALPWLGLALSRPSVAAESAPPGHDRLAAAAPTRATAPATLALEDAMVAIPAGTYRLGREDGRRDERPAHAVTLAAFRIDRTEVTAAAFADYLNALALPVRGGFAAGGFGPEHATDRSVVGLLAEGREGSGAYPIIALDDTQSLIVMEDGRFAARPGFADHPVTETTWDGARAYCLWRGARLPTEAEWEAAARGAEGRPFPWGAEAPDESRVFVSHETGRTAPVGSRPAGATPEGVLDMAGSLAEWTSTLKRPYPYDAADGREDPTQTGERVTRGGDYRYDTEPARLTATHRDGFSNAPDRGHRHIGFRCVRDAPGA